MFKKGQLVKSPGGIVYGVVNRHSRTDPYYVWVTVVNGPAAGHMGMVAVHTLELIGNNYRAKPKCSR